MACFRTKLHFMANGCVLGQNARKETPFKIQFYCKDNINLLSAPFLNLINGIGLFFLPHFHPLCLLAGNLQPDFQIAVTHSILKLKSFLNTTIQNDLKWRKTCTGLKFDLEHFYGPQTKFIRDSLYKHPVHITISTIFISTI